MTAKALQKLVWDYYRKYGRDLPWRKTRDPYRIVVSEVMLQQTQVERVIPYYERFIKQFSSFRVLARAEQGDVLRAWQGLGYNRRALNLQKLARVVISEHEGKLPATFEGLDALPGIGKGTAGSLSAFVFNKPVPFIETNIRRVFIHHFFKNKQEVRDDEILKLVERTLPARRAREWYYALMDYGSHLGKKVENPNRKSAHYGRQSRFEGSNRQLRGAILRGFLSGLSETELERLAGSKTKLARVRGELEKEGFLSGFRFR